MLRQWLVILSAIALALLWVLLSARPVLAMTVQPQKATVPISEEVKERHLEIREVSTGT